MKTYKAILFDFDGTLINSAPGIMLALTLMLEELGLRPLTREELLSCIGPPIHKFFPELLGLHGDEMRHAIEVYRRIFDEKALSQLDTFPGIVDLLRDIKAAGFLVGIATCKLTHVCERQAESLGITPYVDFISGAVPDKNILEKADVIRGALDGLNVLAADALMVGDRIFDIIGANEVGLDSVGIMHGGCETREEFRRYNPVTVVDDTLGLRAFILG